MRSLFSDVFYVEQPDKPPPASIAADEPRRWPIYASPSALKNFEIFGTQAVQRTPFRNASIRETFAFHVAFSDFRVYPQRLKMHGFRAMPVNKIARSPVLLSKAK
ncbi:hypothetical protein KDX04_15820 [Burkholderia cenocepacia]|uniref:hypothetical protein n=1 Tax=Burkholderia cenocepacia TaxID=95486 RepID=UPI00158F2F35|nr:hypothetical protein [Burkholderia cenocepacia]MBR7987288.1 hypothetical protein [Burkholderia cenocepacia]